MVNRESLGLALCHYGFFLFFSYCYAVKVVGSIYSITVVRLQHSRWSSILASLPHVCLSLFPRFLPFLQRSTAQGAWDLWGEEFNHLSLLEPKGQVCQD